MFFLSGSHLRQNEGANKVFPCFTIRRLDPYKKYGFFFTTKDYTEQSYGLRDIFKEETISRLKNTSVFQFKETHTIFHGNIIVICPIEKKNLKDRIDISLKKGPTYELYFYPRGEDLWFGLARFPTYISIISIDTSTMQSADIAISEREMKQLTKTGSPCQNYDSESSPEIGFVECGREAIERFLKSNINCSIPGMRLFFSRPNELPECQSKESAKESYFQFINKFMYYFLANPSDYGCPLPCTQTSYNLEIKYFHKTAFMDVFDKVICNLFCFVIILQIY